jgi:hypothetical protein
MLEHVTHGGTPPSLQATRWKSHPDLPSGPLLVSLAALLGFVHGNHVGYGPACRSNGRSGSLVVAAHSRALLDVLPPAHPAPHVPQC